MGEARSTRSPATLEQRRARHAWDVVKRLAKQGKTTEVNDFVIQAKKLPTRIMTSGLGQAIAFLSAKGNSQALIDAIADWVLAERRLGTPSQYSGHALIESIIAGNSTSLRRSTDETLAYLQWLNRFVDAMGLKGES